MSFPPGWKLEHAEGATRLTAPEQGGALALSCFWRDGPQGAAVERILDLEQLFPRRRNVQPLKTVDAYEQCVGFLGQAPVVDGAPWWRRLFRRRQWRNWRVWCLSRAPVYILAMYTQAGNVDHEAETVASMIVGSIRLSDPPGLYS
ncbi:MAG: hypothetical protein ACM3U2_00060 [Deltaproteobacteria bacterium]